MVVVRFVQRRRYRLFDLYRHSALDSGFAFRLRDRALVDQWQRMVFGAQIQKLEMMFAARIDVTFLVRALNTCVMQQRKRASYSGIDNFGGRLPRR
jgi:hypothetical protein